MNDALRRKLVQRRPADRDPPLQAAQCWRLALARAARDAAGLELVVNRIETACRDQHEVIELLPERGLLVLLRGPAQRLGMMALSPEVTGSLIESQTIGRVQPGPAPQRRPTRIDAAMVAGWIQRALSGLNAGVSQQEDEAWARGYHYDSFVDTSRAMELLLEERPHRTLVARLSLAGGARAGTVLLALPDTGAIDGARPDSRREAAAPAVATPEVPDFTGALARAVLDAECLLEAVLARASLPLSMLLALRVGQTLPLGCAALDAVTLEDINATAVARARLGQQRGLRAVRVVPPGAMKAGVPAAAGGPVHGMASDSAPAPLAALLPVEDTGEEADGMPGALPDMANLPFLATG